MNTLFEQYLKILGIKKEIPSLEYLSKLTASHLMKIPFENISKIYYFNSFGLQSIPDLELYLNGIENNNFGGTCYSNNYYFNQLLNYVGFEALLYGADMSLPDVHLVNAVVINSKEYLVDVGYGSPLFNPIPLFSNRPIKIKFGNEEYRIQPKDQNGFSELINSRDNKILHGYKINPKKRKIKEFDKVIEDSFKPNAEFLNRITAIKFYNDYSISIRNLSFIEMSLDNFSIRKIDSKEQLVNEIYKIFKIPKEKIKKSVKYVM